VLKNIPANSHLQFDFIMPFSAIAHTDWRLKDNIWDSYDSMTISNSMKISSHAGCLCAFSTQANKIIAEHIKRIRLLSSYSL